MPAALHSYGFRKRPACDNPLAFLLPEHSLVALPGHQGLHIGAAILIVLKNTADQWVRKWPIQKVSSKTQLVSSSIPTRYHRFQAGTVNAKVVPPFRPVRV
jgi:hypothetical protein